ncbi:hypothetical protein FRC03_000660 [Tulasnella sp. 419]|nr:hypothetical protein FRC03_000660 [Tulasnella sp. 419]
MSTPSDSKSSVPETSSTPIDAQDAKPDRSRNAKAQARHRAKRKAYIEQLESTVTELKAALAENGSKSVDDKITALTEENQRLREELQRLRVQAEQHLNGEPSAKKRRVSTEEDSSYLGPMMLSDSPRAASHGLNGAKLDVPQLRAPPHIQQHHMPLTQPLNIGSLHFTQDRPASAQSTSSQKPRIGPSPLGFPNGIPSYAQTGQSQPHLASIL